LSEQVAAALPFCPRDDFLVKDLPVVGTQSTINDNRDGFQLDAGPEGNPTLGPRRAPNALARNAPTRSKGPVLTPLDKKPTQGHRACDPEMRVSPPKEIKPPLLR